MSVSNLSDNIASDYVYEAIDRFERKYPMLKSADAIEFSEVISQKELEIYSDFMADESMRDMYSGLLKRAIQPWERPIVTDFETHANVIRISMTSMH